MSVKSGYDNLNETTQVWQFKGKYSTYGKDLMGEAAPHQKIFDKSNKTYYNEYAFCCLVGLFKKKTHKYDPQVDNPDKVEPLGFRWTSAESSGLFDYYFLRKFVILNENVRLLEFNERVDYALKFDYPTNDVKDEDHRKNSKYGENSAIIDQYVLGGLEYIHEKIMDCKSSTDVIKFMKESIDEISDMANEYIEKHNL